MQVTARRDIRRVLRAIVAVLAAVGLATVGNTLAVGSNVVPQGSPASSPGPTTTPSDDATPQPPDPEPPDAGLPATGVSSEASVGSWLVAAIGGVVGLAMLRHRPGPRPGQTREGREAGDVEATSPACFPDADQRR